VEIAFPLSAVITIAGYIASPRISQLTPVDGVRTTLMAPLFRLWDSMALPSLSLSFSLSFFLFLYLRSVAKCRREKFIVPL